MRAARTRPRRATSAAASFLPPASSSQAFMGVRMLQSKPREDYMSKGGRYSQCNTCNRRSRAPLGDSALSCPALCLSRKPGHCALCSARYPPGGGCSTSSSPCFLSCRGPLSGLREGPRAACERVHLAQQLCQCSGRRRSERERDWGSPESLAGPPKASGWARRPAQRGPCDADVVGWPTLCRACDDSVRENSLIMAAVVAWKKRHTGKETKIFHGQAAQDAARAAAGAAVVTGCC